MHLRDEMSLDCQCNVNVSMSEHRADFGNQGLSHNVNRCAAVPSAGDHKASARLPISHSRLLS
jgi:hypothetical protein